MPEIGDKCRGRRMKRNILFVLLMMITLVVYFESWTSYNRGYDRGFEAGRIEGLRSPLFDTLKWAYDSGYTDGSNSNNITPSIRNVWPRLQLRFREILKSMLGNE